MSQGPPAGPQVWHVYTDGSSRHERRQTFSGWAARAVQPETRQVRQISGARPGGTSLEAETEALLSGLQLVPAGATARLYSDLDPAALHPLLQSPQAEAARVHLHELWVQPIARNSNGHHHDAHRLARAAETQLREEGPQGLTGLDQNILAAEALARSGAADPPLALHQPWMLPGVARPLELQGQDARYSTVPSGQVQATLSLGLSAQGQGRAPTDALQEALGEVLRPLARASLLHLRVPPAWLPAACRAAQELGTVRVLASEASTEPGS